MPVISHVFQDAIGTSIPTTGETVAIVTPPISTSSPGARVVLSGVVRMTTGAGTTSVNLRIRRGSTATAPLVVLLPVAVAAGASVAIPFAVRDSVGEVAGQVYAVTLEPVGATSAGTVNAAGVVIVAE